MRKKKFMANVIDIKIFNDFIKKNILFFINYISVFNSFINAYLYFCNLYIKINIVLRISASDRVNNLHYCKNFNI
jgi:hypothetical protein